MSYKESPTKNKKKRQRKDKEEDGETKSKKLKGDDVENENHIEQEAPIVSDVTWTDEQMKLLLSRIEGQLPKNDSVSFKKSLTTVSWDDVKFEQFTGDQCRAEFLSILSKLRKYRTLTEILGDAVKWVDAPRKKTSHPDKPAKPLTSYLIFYMEKRPKLAKKYPDMKLTELTQKIADKFKHLPPEKKQKYIDKAENKKEEYLEKMKKFYELHPDQLVAEAAPKKKPNPAGLFRPQPPFKNYCDKKLKEHDQEENFDQKAFVARCKEKWAKMSDKKKFVWLKWTVEKEEEFMEKMKIFQASNPEQCTLSDFKSVLTKEEKNLYEKMCGKPEKPPNSAYILFCREYLKECAAGSQKEKMRECSEKWKAMTNVEKSEFTDRLKHMQAKYEFEYSSYLSKLPEEKRRAELEMEKAKIKKRAAVSTQKAETMCNALENFIQRSDKNPVAKLPERFENEPVEPPQSTKEYFIKKYLSEKSGPEGAATSTQAKNAWKALSEKKKLKCKKELTLLKAKYIQEYEVFLKSLGETELQEYVKRRQKKASSSEDNDDEESEEGSSEETSSEEEEADEEQQRKGNSKDTQPRKENSKDTQQRKEQEEDDEDDTSTESSSD